MQEEKGWVREFRELGITSSPRAADLNGDGVMDIVVGTNKNEFVAADTAVVALSGSTGEILWTVPAADQIFGSAAFLDINRDGGPDVLIGGRSAVFMAINGRTGEILWEFTEEPADDGTFSENFGRYNFYNAQIIPDQSGDGLEDILVSGGGGGVSSSPDDRDRFPGKLVVIDSANGKELARSDMPDGREIYMSPVAVKMQEGEEDLTIIFGTGGETVGGSLYRITLKELMEGDISQARILVTSERSGFIAPPVLADLSGNGYYDVVAIAFDGHVTAVDGRDDSVIWESRIEGERGIFGSIGAYASLAPGRFNEDDTPDFVTAIPRGVFPNFDKTLQVVLDGRTGEVVFRDSLNVGQMSSPVIADFNNDGQDDALMSINFRSVENGIPVHENVLAVYDLHSEQIFQLEGAGRTRGINLASTPWIGDLDGNGRLDVVYASTTDIHNSGSRITRLPTNIRLSSPLRWGAYMGSNYDGIY